MNMSSEQLKTLGEKFIKLSGMFSRFIERNGLGETRLDMDEANDTRTEYRSLCETPLCHGGWLAVMFEQENILQDGYKPHDSTFYIKGATQVANFLGFDNKNALRAWASRNPEMWGNEFGVFMFVRKAAFGIRGFLYDLTLTDIANHYAAVGERCIAKSQSDTSNGGQS